jgi:hypothetical protein
MMQAPGESPRAGLTFDMACGMGKAMLFANAGRTITFAM